MLDILNWQKELSKAIPDPEVGISLAYLAGDHHFTTYVTEIKPGRRVEARYHPQGTEIYHILSGQGVMYTGHLQEDGKVLPLEATVVKAGDFFTIHPGMVHQLNNTHDESLTLIVTCSPTNLQGNRVRVASQN